MTAPAMTPTGTLDVLVLPPDLQETVDEIRDRYRLPLALQMSEELMDAGVEPHIAMHIAAQELRLAAARLVVMACAIEKREPRRELWMKRAGEDFDQACAWMRELDADETLQSGGQC